MGFFWVTEVRPKKRIRLSKVKVGQGYAGQVVRLLWLLLLL